MRFAEKKCRKIKSGWIQFSPEAAMWIKRSQIYKSILRYHAGRIQNKGNLKRAARRCGIDHPLSIPIKEIYLRLQTCISQCDHFRKHGRYYRRKPFTPDLKPPKKEMTRRQPTRFSPSSKGRKREVSGEE